MLFLLLSGCDTLTNIAGEENKERSSCWYIAWSYPPQFRVTSLHCCALQRDQRHLNQTGGWNASSTDYFHFSPFTPSSCLFVSLHLFCRLQYRYRNVCLQMFLSIGFNVFSAKDCQPQKNLLCFPQLLPDKGKTFLLKIFWTLQLK